MSTLSSPNARVRSQAARAVPESGAPEARGPCAGTARRARRPGRRSPSSRSSPSSWGSAPSSGYPFLQSGPYLPSPTLPWWVLALAFAATESSVLHIQRGRRGALGLDERAAARPRPLLRLPAGPAGRPAGRLRGHPDDACAAARRSRPSSTSPCSPPRRPCRSPCSPPSAPGAAGTSPWPGSAPTPASSRPTCSAAAPSAWSSRCTTAGSGCGRAGARRLRRPGHGADGRHARPRRRHEPRRLHGERLAADRVRRAAAARLPGLRRARPSGTSTWSGCTASARR